MTYIELSIYDENDNQLEMFLKNYDNKCKPIKDKSSCLWAETRCFTFLSITKRLFGILSVKEISYNNLLEKNSINSINTINYINISINPDHTFSLFKLENDWYYISSWMLLYTGVIIKIDNILDFLDCINKFFILVNFKDNRKKEHNKFINFIETYFIFKIYNYGNNNVIKINNFSLINQLVYRTGENMIEQMLNLNKIKKDNIIKNKIERYKVYIRIATSPNLKKHNIHNIYKNFYNSYILKVYDFANKNTNEIMQDYYLLRSNNLESFIKKFDNILEQYQSKNYQTNKYIFKIKKNIMDNQDKLFKIYTDMIKKYKDNNIITGGSYNLKNYDNGNELYFNQNGFIINQIFMGNIIDLHNPGFKISSDNTCNIMNLIKYYDLIQFITKNKNDFFYNITSNLFKHYNDNSKAHNKSTYLITKKYYKINSDNKNIGDICQINISDQEVLYTFIILNLNGFHLILPELFIKNEQDLKKYIFYFITKNKILIIKTISSIKLNEYNINSIKELNLINYCTLLSQYKLEFIKIIKQYNIIEPIHFLIFLIYSLFNNNIKHILKTNFNSLEETLKFNLLFDIVKIVYDDNINETKQNYGIDISDIFYNTHDNNFYKNIYLVLKKL